MSAKPGKSRPKSPQARPAAAKKPATKSSDKAASDDPFDVAPSVAGKAVPLLPKPGKGKLHRVTCPMCETPGFQSRQVAGRDVRCANEACLVPIFKAPAVEEEKAVEPEPVTKSGGLGTVHYIAIGVVAAAALGGVAWLAGGESAPNPDEVVFVEPPPVQGGNPVVAPGSDPAIVETPAATTGNGDPVKPAATDYSSIQADALKMMVAFSQQRENNDDKPTCRRLSAEAYAIVGDLDEVEQQLTQLTKVGPQLPYYHILPATHVAWLHLRAGRQAEAGAAIDKVLPQVDRLPPYGQFAFDTMAELGVVMIAIGRLDEVAALFEKRERDAIQTDSGAGQLMESVLRCQFIPGTRFDQTAPLRPALGWSNPQRVAVTVGLVAHGSADKALAWAERAPNAAALRDCLSAWAEASLLTARSAVPMTQINARMSSLPPADRAWVLSRCALTLHSLGDAQAVTVLDSARTAITSAGTPQPMTLPDAKRDVNLKFPDTVPLTQAANAAIELAHAQSLLGQADAAANSIELAMNYTRAMAPGVTTAERQADEPRRVGEAVVMAELKAIHSLQTDDDVKTAFLQYTNRSKQIRDAAVSRFEQQQLLLAAACVWGPASLIWDQVKASQDTEPWFDTTVPAVLLARFKTQQDTASASALESTVGVDRLKEHADPRVATAAQTDALVASAQFVRAAALLDQFARSTKDASMRIWQQEQLGRLSSRLASEKRTADAFAFMSAIADPQVRQTAFELVSTEAADGDAMQQVLDFGRTARISAPDKVSVLRGLIEAIARRAQAGS